MPPVWENVKKTLKTKKLEVLGLSKAELEAYAGAFDPDYYRQQVGRPEMSDEQALQHYLIEGWHAGHDPSATFSVRDYLAANPDVSAARIDPLTHYLRHGMREQRVTERAQTYHCEFTRVTLETVQGWCIGLPATDQVFEVRLLVDGELFTTFEAGGDRCDPGNENRTGIDEEVPLKLLDPGTHQVSIVMPDGTRLDHEIKVPRSEIRPRRAYWESAASTALKVVVPIYNAAEDVEICIQRLIAYTPKSVEVILIDDCSPDPAIQKILKTVAGNPQFRVLKNKKNQGFTTTVNRGLEEAKEADVIILNSDARVTPNWSEGLLQAAHTHPNVATVTAMSDRAGAFSAPNIGNDNALPPGITEADFARAFRRNSLRLYPEVPTGNGFCMYIRRAAIDALGPLDQKAFPRGYGEENDFCMRALRAGWVNLIDDATYVFHERTKSFGEAKTEHITKGRKVIDQRYPEYKTLIRRYHSAPLIKLARHRARLALRDCSTGTGIKKRAVFVTATQTGGTPQTNADLMGALEDAFETWVLRCSSRVLELSLFRKGEQELIRRHVLREPIEPTTHTSHEYDRVVADWLLWLDAELVHIRHLAWHSLTLPAVAKASGARVVYSMHDFYTLCPSLKLLDNTNSFCGGSCTKGEGTCKIVLWEPKALPKLKNAWVHEWRAKMARALEPCDAYVTTSESTRARVLEHLPALSKDRFHVIPHGRDFLKFEQTQSRLNYGDPIRVLVPGNIDDAKGLKIIEDVIHLDTLRIFEFHVMGNVKKSSLRGPTPRLHLHGPYKRETLSQMVRKVSPHFGIVLSIWDETFCHTLTEMWSMGLPVAVLDYPTLRSRVEDSGAGWVIKDKTAKGVHAAFSDIISDPEALRAKGEAAITWQSRLGAGATCRQMAARYMDVYRSPQKAAARPDVAVMVPGNPALTSAYASSEIRVWERTRNSLARPVNYVRMNANGFLANMEMGKVSGAIIQRTAIPGRTIDALVDTATRLKVPYIYEIDDNLMEVPKDKDPSGFYQAYAPFLRKLIENAAGVTVSNDLLADQMSAWNKNITVLPNRLSARLWGGIQPRMVTSNPSVLYMGSVTHGADLELVLPALERARQTLPGLRLRLIGVTEQGNLPDWVDVIPIQKEHKEYTDFVPWLKTQVQEIDLAIAPLVDSEFNNYKSGLKILDYAALGLPVLASKVPPYENLVGAQPPAGITLLDNRTEVWAQQLVAKLGQRKSLHAMAPDLRNWTFEHHALEPTLPDFDSFVLKTIGKPG